MSEKVSIQDCLNYPNLMRHHTRNLGLRPSWFQRIDCLSEVSWDVSWIFGNGNGDNSEEIPEVIHPWKESPSKWVKVNWKDNNWYIPEKVLVKQNQCIMSTTIITIGKGIAEINSGRWIDRRRSFPSPSGCLEAGAHKKPHNWVDSHDIIAKNEINCMCRPMSKRRSALRWKRCVSFNCRQMPGLVIGAYWTWEKRQIEEWTP